MTKVSAMKWNPFRRQATASPRRPPGAYAGAGVEPALEELMTEPIIGALMARDRVRPDEVRALLAAARQSLVARNSDTNP